MRPVSSPQKRAVGRAATRAAQGRGESDHPNSDASMRADDCEADSKPSRRSRSREATRAKLIDAALNVFAEKGIESSTIADITEAADVGFGSFYNHFTSKTELATLVFEARAKELARIGDLIAEHEKDAATVVAFVQRWFLTQAVNDPVWGWFIVHAAQSLPEMEKVFMAHGTRDIRRGVIQGRFSVNSEETAMRVILAALQGMMRALLEKVVGPSAVNETIECLLRMLGVDNAEAQALAALPLPEYVSSSFSR